MKNSNIHCFPILMYETLEEFLDKRIEEEICKETINQKKLNYLDKLLFHFNENCFYDRVNKVVEIQLTNEQYDYLFDELFIFADLYYEVSSLYDKLSNLFDNLYKICNRNFDRINEMSNIINNQKNLIEQLL